MATQDPTSFIKDNRPSVSTVTPNGFINQQQLEKLAQPLAKNGYGQYLFSLLSSRA